MINTRILSIALPSDKAAQVQNEVKFFLQTKVTNRKRLETLLGYLTRVESIIPGAYHFLYDTRKQLFKFKYNDAPISSECKEKLLL